jgi:hypothetical protein
VALEDSLSSCSTHCLCPPRVGDGVRQTRGQLTWRPKLQSCDTRLDEPRAVRGRRGDNDRAARHGFEKGHRRLDCLWGNKRQKNGIGGLKPGHFVGIFEIVKRHVDGHTRNCSKMLLGDAGALHQIACRVRAAVERLPGREGDEVHLPRAGRRGVLERLPHNPCGESAWRQPAEIHHQRAIGTQTQLLSSLITKARPKARAVHAGGQHHQFGCRYAPLAQKWNKCLRRNGKSVDPTAEELRAAPNEYALPNTERPDHHMRDDTRATTMQPRRERQWQTEQVGHADVTRGDRLSNAAHDQRQS